MISIPTVLLFAIISLGFVATPVALSLFCKNKKINHKLSTVGVILFSVIALILTLNKVSLGLDLVKINFSTTGNWFSKVFQFWNGNLKDYIINTLMFVPLGVIAIQHACSKSEKKSTAIIKSMIAGLLLSCTIELGQFILPVNRFPAFNDILLNTISAGLGAFSMTTLHSIKEHLENHNENKDNQIQVEDTILLKENDFVNMVIHQPLYSKKLQLNKNFFSSSHFKELSNQVVDIKNFTTEQKNNENYFSL